MNGNNLVDGHGTGAVFRENDPRDRHLEFIPQVAEVLDTGVPESYHVIEPGQMPFVYDQGPEGSCCPTSICGGKTIEDWFDVKTWNHYDSRQMYHDLGGTGNNGIAADPALRYARDIGCRDIVTGRRFRIGSYAFAPRNYGEWRRVLAAALVALGPSPVAMLLPNNFGWDSSGPLSKSYHQVLYIGHDGLGDNDWSYYLNSWGEGSGHSGIVRVRWGGLEANDFQQRHVYGAKMVDITDYIEPDPDPGPVPIPPDPTKPPILDVARMKKTKLVLVGENMVQFAMVFVDGKQVAAQWRESNWMIVKRLNLAPGLHTVSIRNISQGPEASQTFEVQGEL